ncbi:MAG: metallophosphoesterase family protein [Vulcanimicrobiaceae bacterium]
MSELTLGVISDTHLPHFGSALPRALLDGLRDAGVTQILHCGDHTSPLTEALLARVAPVVAVAGNCDGYTLVERWGRRRIVTAGGVRIGLVHGHEGSGRDTPSRAYGAFEKGTVDVVCFGHSHQPLIERRAGVLLLNPGSPTDKRREARYSFALLCIGAGKAEAELRYFDDRSA